MQFNELVSVNSILDYFQEQVAQNLPVSPSRWIDGALKLAVLLGEQNDKLFELHQKVAQLRADHIEKGESVAKAKALVEALDAYKEYCKQKARIEQIYEFIRLSKLRSRISLEEYKA